MKVGDRVVFTGRLAASRCRPAIGCFGQVTRLGKRITVRWESSNYPYHDCYGAENRDSIVQPESVDVIENETEAALAALAFLG